ncbi:hypothetical protein QEH56_23245 [Pelagicoccus enzymogenes]|uniref:hypothetical protein n=1 Tax=Pelagicoccus enzymogenes TaxID=2773457 RepID=UPI00280CC55F|nr:hypothetical protein [Pelagicoccus enzymogenes]MDQ8201101.1 hypothetical protein [Pelagicoccus enzymogenes]
MNAAALAITIALVVVQFRIKKEWAFVPLLVAAVHTSHIPNIADFTTARILIVAGLLRAIFSGEKVVRLDDSIDKTMVAMCCLIFTSSVAHDFQFGNPYKYRTGLILNLLGSYYYGRYYISDVKCFKNLCSAIPWVLIPLAVFMTFESVSGSNPYAFVGARLTTSIQRLGEIRAGGPFGTPILAGTVGAVNIGVCVILWRDNRKLAIAGLFACFTIMVTSHSSTPLGAAFILCAVIAVWKHRHKAAHFIWLSGFALLVLHFIKERPIWYLIALVDLVGGSTGWHRSKLIDQAVANIGDWWLAGTDYTANWMPYKLPTNPNHCDLTNYFIHLGVIAGIPAAACLLYILYSATKRALPRAQEDSGEYNFLMWCVIATIITHSITFLTISYYDQIYIFFYLLIASVPALLRNSTETR